MAFSILIILFLLPLVLYFLFSVKFGLECKLSTYYISEAVIVLLITTYGHFYYYQNYNLNIFPSMNHVIFSIGIGLIGLLFTLIVNSFKKDKGLSMKGTALLVVFFVCFFNWVLPLGQKYYYAERIDAMEDIFSTQDSKNVITDGDLMIALVESDQDSLVRPRYRSPGYSNYFYIKNTGDTPYEGNVYFTLFDENNESFDVKLIENVKVGANAIELLSGQKNNIFTDEWSETSFGTKREVKKFEVVLTNN